MTRCSAAIVEMQFLPEGREENPRTGPDIQLLRPLRPTERMVYRRGQYE